MTLTINRLTAALGRSYRLYRELGAGGMATVGRVGVGRVVSSSAVYDLSALFKMTIIVT